ncbi:MAG: MATE family efflux transporter [Lachnospiraceae bacterium]|nr:MATE family efflux transporter [Lachnospiraceae bacterium]
MDFLTGNIRQIFFKYLAAAFGSALISSIYGAVDMAMVGQYQGPNGTAALAVVAPVWNVIYSLGLLMGIGGSVIFSTLRGESTQNLKRSNEVFTASLVGGAMLALLAWIALLLWDAPVLRFFGADTLLLELAQAYLYPVKFVFPVYLFNQLLAAFLRNDGAPALATRAVLAGGIFNIFGDYFFVFTLNMGIKGAGLATAMGAVISLVIMLTHFFSRNNTLRLVYPKRIVYDTQRITVTGFASFFIDVAMGIITILFNRQILKYLGSDALAVYGIIINISTFVQACAYSIGQAAQPIISMNYGARQGKRITDVMKYAVGTAVVFGMIWTVLVLAVPNAFVYLFMTPTSSVLQIAPAIIRGYGISFLILPINILSTYYFQAISRPGASFVVSVARGAVISGALILLLPLIHPDAIWYAMPITELIVLIYVILAMKKNLARTHK